MVPLKGFAYLKLACFTVGFAFVLKFFGWTNTNLSTCQFLDYNPTNGYGSLLYTIPRMRAAAALYIASFICFIIAGLLGAFMIYLWHLRQKAIVKILFAIFCILAGVTTAIATGLALYPGCMYIPIVFYSSAAGLAVLAGIFALISLCQKEGSQVVNTVVYTENGVVISSAQARPQEGYKANTTQY